MYRDFMSTYDIFKNNGSCDPLLDTLRLFDLLTNGKTKEALSLPVKEIVDVKKIAHERQKGLPMEYILGRATFMGRSFYCSRGALIPTEETSLLVMTAYNLINERLRSGLGAQTIIEIGTGCGNIAVSLAQLCDNNVAILASDVSLDAVEVARKNVTNFGAQDKVSLFCGDLFEPFKDYEGKIDVVICNPPYIPTSSLKKLSAEIIDYEPIVALDGGPYGINIFRKLMHGALTVLKSGGILAFEIGEGQENLIGKLFEKNTSYSKISQFKHGEHVRVISAVKK